MQYFQTRFLEEADKFIAGLDTKAARKVFYNIDLAEQSNDPKLFKKLQKDIWEFRTKFGGVQIRLLAFWDKDKETETLVFATHGFIKIDSMYNWYNLIYTLPNFVLNSQISF